MKSGKFPALCNVIFFYWNKNHRHIKINSGLHTQDPQEISVSNYSDRQYGFYNS